MYSTFKICVWKHTISTLLHNPTNIRLVLALFYSLDHEDYWIPETYNRYMTLHRNTTADILMWPQALASQSLFIPLVRKLQFKRTYSIFSLYLICLQSYRISQASVPSVCILFWGPGCLQRLAIITTCNFTHESKDKQRNFSGKALRAINVCPENKQVQDIQWAHFSEL